MNAGKNKEIKNLRREYTLNRLSEETVNLSPLIQFGFWFKDVVNAEITEPNAMVLATADRNAKPSARVVLLKGFSEEGFLFFTNYQSKKGRELTENPVASLLFFWADLERQVRIEGKVKRLKRTESTNYFNSRPAESRLGTWASKQSNEIPGREYLEEQYARYQKKFEGNVIPAPGYWGGYKLIPDYFEFWQGRENRLHDRIAYKKNKRKWEIARISP